LGHNYNPIFAKSYKLNNKELIKLNDDNEWFEGLVVITGVFTIDHPRDTLCSLHWNDSVEPKAQP